MMIRFSVSMFALAGALCAVPSVAGAQAAANTAKAPTVAEADAFVAEAERVFAAKSVDASRVA